MTDRVAKTTRRENGIDCICTVEQVKNNAHEKDCEWCNAGFECNPDLSDPNWETYSGLDLEE